MRTFLAALLGLALLATTSSAAIIGQLGVLQDTANGGINPATGSAWQAGDTYHLAFVTSGTRDATSPNIADYHTFVQNAAAAAGMGGATWYNIGKSENEPDRDTNAPPMTTSFGIFLVNSAKLADDGADLANGPDIPFNITELGTEYNGYVATGSGKRFGSVNGPPAKNSAGKSDRTDGKWWQIASIGQASQQHFYAISEELTVIPEPASLALIGLGGLAMLRRRRA